MFLLTLYLLATLTLSAFGLLRFRAKPTFLQISHYTCLFSCFHLFLEAPVSRPYASLQEAFCKGVLSSREVVLHFKQF